MNRETYRLVEDYMLSCLRDSAHDREHIYRVLYAALDIANHEDLVNQDVLICACLLHDVGRPAQAANPKLCHAAVGAEMARAFLTEQGFGPAFAAQVADCVRAHRFRGQATCGSIEAKILFDADKLDAIGALGVARTLLYQGQASEPLYTRLPDGTVCDGSGDAPASFFREYRFKLQNLRGKLNTRRARELADARQDAAERFYRALLGEVRALDESGPANLRRILEKGEPAGD